MGLRQHVAPDRRAANAPERGRCGSVRTGFPGAPAQCLPHIVAVRELGAFGSGAPGRHLGNTGVDFDGGSAASAAVPVRSARREGEGNIVGVGAGFMAAGQRQARDGAMLASPSPQAWRRGSRSSKSRILLVAWRCSAPDADRRARCRNRRQ